MISTISQPHTHMLSIIDQSRTHVLSIIRQPHTQPILSMVFRMVFGMEIWGNATQCSRVVRCVHAAMKSCQHVISIPAIMFLHLDFGYLHSEHDSRYRDDDFITAWQHHNCIRDTTQGPSWVYLKVNFSETLSIFGDKRPRNGSKNGSTAPRTGLGYPHIVPFVVY